MRLMLILAVLTLCSCASWRTGRPSYAPPRIDCAATDLPRAPRPVAPSGDASVPAWQLYAWKWQDYALDVLSQRGDTAQCLDTLRREGVIR